MLLITKRAAVWRLTCVGVTRAVAEHPSRDCLVRLAHAIASKRGRTVYVYNELGHLERMRTFIAPREPDLEAAR